MSSDCGGARSLLRRDGTAELVSSELVQVSLPSLRSLHVVLVAIVNRHVVRCVHASPRNDVIFSQNLPIMLALCSMLLCTYYAHFNAGIISAPLQGAGPPLCTATGSELVKFLESLNPTTLLFCLE